MNAAGPRQLARERDAACVVLEHHDGGREVRPSRLAGTVRLRIAAMPPCAPRFDVWA